MRILLPDYFLKVASRLYLGHDYCFIEYLFDELIPIKESKAMRAWGFW